MQYSKCKTLHHIVFKTVSQKFTEKCEIFYRLGRWKLFHEMTLNGHTGLNVPSCSCCLPVRWCHWHDWHICRNACGFQIRQTNISSCHHQEKVLLLPPAAAEGDARWRHQGLQLTRNAQLTGSSDVFVSSQASITLFYRLPAGPLSHIISECSFHALLSQLHTDTHSCAPSYESL